jgi:hypothetical protein
MSTSQFNELVNILLYMAKRGRVKLAGGIKIADFKTVSPAPNIITSVFKSERGGKTSREGEATINVEVGVM